MENSIKSFDFPGLPIVVQNSKSPVLYAAFTYSDAILPLSPPNTDGTKELIEAPKEKLSMVKPMSDSIAKQSSSPFLPRKSMVADNELILGKFKTKLCGFSFPEHHRFPW